MAAKVSPIAITAYMIAIGMPVATLVCILSIPVFVYIHAIIAMKQKENVEIMLAMHFTLFPNFGGRQSTKIVTPKCLLSFTQMLIPKKTTVINKYLDISSPLRFGTPIIYLSMMAAIVLMVRRHRAIIDIMSSIFPNIKSN